uniref:Uncharacterized protein n=1 Tax=Sphaeramia orbicularis TaxID=375764 RepID=A0A673CH39_9TELE
MAAASCLLCEHQFLCSICLDVFTDPVTTSCGHNFCKSCITEHFNVNVPYQCPMCKEVFHTKPQLKINTFISEMVAQFRHEAQKRANSSRICMKHDKPLELFCKTDHTCICLLCLVLDHKNHEFVPLRKEHEEQKTELKKIEAEIWQMIQERQLKIQEIQHSVDLGKKAADRQTAEGVEVFTALMESAQRSLIQLKEEIQEKQRTTEKQAEDFIKELEQEISELKKRGTELKQLSGCEDHLHFVQRFSSVNTAPPMKTWTKVSVRPPSYEGTVVRAVSQLEDKLRKDMKKMVEAELKRVQQYEVDVTLDPDTANSWLVLSEDEKQFLCSICLDIFTDPVTMPCGHNFCKHCITEHFAKNTWTSAKPGEALKSCLVCLTSYCQTHLEPHLTLSVLKRHQLIHPVENLEDRMCMKHDKPLELFCKTDHTCICLHCTYKDHMTHEFVPLKEEHKKQKAELKKTGAEIQQMIQERQLKIQEIQHSVDLSKKAADRQTAEGVEVFTALMESVQRSLDQLIEEIQEKQRTTEKQAEDFIRELEQEISELKKRSTEVEQLSGSENHLHFVQGFTSIKTAPPMKTWTKVSVHPPSYEESVVKTVSQLENKVKEDKIKLLKVKLKTVQQYEVDVTLDPDTAYPKLILSDDGKQVSCGVDWKNLPDKPERFSICRNVLGKQSFCSGRFYFEVQVKGKTNWSLGVVRESINRKAYIMERPQNGYWTIWLRNRNQYRARTDPPIHLSLESGPQKVGVFVDYEEGLVSFYDVDSSALIYSFTDCCFSDKLLPFFSPCGRDGEGNRPNS